MSRKQSGFTLVEIAIVLVIIGLLLGTILKGQELINSARVRNLADLASATQVAFYGFRDRYREVPGDMPKALAERAIGGTINGNPSGNHNGRLDPGTYNANRIWDEPNAAWEQLSKAKFIQGEYAGTARREPSPTNSLAPVNPFNNPMLLGITSDYVDTDQNPPARMNLIMGRGVSVDLIRELDVKMDDGKPASGVVRATTGDANVSVFVGTNRWGGSDNTCVAIPADGSEPFYNAGGDSLDCNAVLLF